MSEEIIAVNDFVAIEVIRHKARALDLETVGVSETQTAIQSAKTRQIAIETTALAETIQVFKNDIELVPPVVVIEPPPTIHGARPTYPAPRRRRLIVFQTTFKIIVIAPVIIRENYPLLSVTVIEQKEKPSLLLRIKKAFLPEKPKPRELKPITILTQFSLDVKAPVLIRDAAIEVKADKIVTMRKQNAFRNLLKMGSMLLFDEDDRLMTERRQRALKQTLKMGSIFLLDEED